MNANNEKLVFKSILDEVGISQTAESIKKQRENSDFKELAECEDLFRTEFDEPEATFPDISNNTLPPEPQQNYVD